MMGGVSLRKPRRVTRLCDGRVDGDGRQLPYIDEVYLGISSADINLGAIPFSHSYGFSNLVTPLLLEGVPVGSRVLLQIPPKLGYGNKAQGEDIPANSTLYFIVDILAAA